MKRLVSILLLTVSVMTAVNLPVAHAEASPELRDLMRTYVTVFDFFLYRLQSRLMGDFIGDGFESFHCLEISYDTAKSVLLVNIEVSELDEYVCEYLLNRTYKGYQLSYPKGFDKDVKKNIDDLKIFALSDVFSRVRKAFNGEPLFLYSGLEDNRYDPETAKARLISMTEIAITQRIKKETGAGKFVIEKSYTTGLRERKWEYAESRKEIEAQKGETYSGQ